MRRLLILLFLSLVFGTPAFAQFDMQQIAVMQGDTDGVSFGIHLAGVGDINKDGIEDLVIGQYGKTFIYFGSKNFDTIPDIVFPFSSGYICHGDVNGDGVQDLLLTRFSLLSVLIYYGGPPFDTIPDKVLVALDTISPPYTPFGLKIATGDINKDGYDDIAIHGNNNKVYVFLGGADMSTSPAYILQGPPNYFGFPGLAIGDVNGDGYADLAVSTSGHYPDDSTYIYFGGPQLDTIPRVKLKGGFVILGDVNGDGYKDIITVEGTYFGGSTIDSLVDSPLCIRGQSWAIGNFNKDKYEDLLSGVPTLAGGEAWIYLGSNPLDTMQDWHYYDSEVGDYGSQVSVADINGDGVDEAIVGDPGWWYAYPDAPIGRVYIYKNPYTAVKDEQNPIPHDFALHQNYPNPFNSSTIIPFSLKIQGSTFKGPIPTTLIIYNILGKKIRILLDEEKLPGNYQVIWDGRDDSGKGVSSGIYFYQLKAGSFNDSKKLLLIK
ncbi:MAG: FG-GAP-like repeat-containing protein [candidate division Zixibacteria bacterium]|nr:FG-GAP-like repeat-containing protein [candidate division Zixibacteria bacterium]